jgi:hypothetical protein
MQLKNTNHENINQLDQNERLDWGTFWDTIVSPMCNRFKKIQDELEKLNDDWIEVCEKFAVEKTAKP